MSRHLSKIPSEPLRDITNTLFLKRFMIENRLFGECLPEMKNAPSPLFQPGKFPTGTIPRPTAIIWGEPIARSVFE